jgi:predicted RNA binding protein YcfA (HicA-like mRNA interferase family)
MKVKDVIRLLEEDGWFWLQRAAVTAIQAPGSAGAGDRGGQTVGDLAPGTLSSILKQSGLKVQH